MTERLPADPTALLSDSERRDLAEALARLAKLRRDAELESGNLRLA